MNNRADWDCCEPVCSDAMKQLLTRHSVGPKHLLAPAPTGEQHGVKRSEFTELESRPSPRRRKAAMVVVLSLLVAGLANLIFFTHLSTSETSRANVEAAGPGVVSIAVAGSSAIVTVTPAWPDKLSENVPRLSTVLVRLGVDRAILVLTDDAAAVLEAPQ